MSDSHTASESAAADLTRLQQQLLRTRIDRARRMTEEQRLAEAFEKKVPATICRSPQVTRPKARVFRQMAAGTFFREWQGAFSGFSSGRLLPGRRFRSVWFLVEELMHLDARLPQDRSQRPLR